MGLRSETPSTGLAGLVQNWKSDLLAGFLVFLIALPLCLGISLASGYPAIAGVFTAIIGGIVTTFLSNSQLTIKGPAAGLIVIAIGAVTELGNGDLSHGYRLALGVGVAAGLVQVLFSLCRLGGVIGDFFPKATVHGMLAAIGVIIFAKQIHVVLGVTPEANGPLELIGEIPSSIVRANPYVAVIGILSLLILFGLPLLRSRWARAVPAPMIVLLVAVPLALAFDMSHGHTYLFLNNMQYTIGPRFLVDVPYNMLEAVALPDFTGLATGVGIKYVIMFSLVGSLESLLSAKAIDLLDPWERKTNLNRDLLAIGVANTLASAVGGLPMISEIVRSKANIDNGARTRFADLFHALFLLGCVALIPFLIHQIPLAALGAMLVYTGFRLASPREFVQTWKIGPEQLIIFLVTLIVTLATDLLLGVACGVLVKFLIHITNGSQLPAMFRAHVDAEKRDAKTTVLIVHHYAIFTNWLFLKKRLLTVEADQDVVLDLSSTRLVDHTVMENLHELQREFVQRGRVLEVIGLEDHHKLSAHPQAARRKANETVSRHGNNTIARPLSERSEHATSGAAPD